MNTIIRAVYEGGVLRPTQPLTLTEGETVDVIITQMNPPAPQMGELTPEEEDYRRRILAAKSLKEMYAVMDSAPVDLEGDFDVVKAINETRRLTGFRMPDPDSTEENAG